MAGQLYENQNSSDCIINKIIENIDINKQNMLDNLIDLLQIKSVQSEAQTDAPYGLGVRKSLEKALLISENLGFETKNIDNHIGYANFTKSDDYYCVIGHLDVVPEETGWTYPEYGGTIHNGKIYARGALDNKGPTISCLYALYAIKQLGILPKKEIRIIYGCNEETGFDDLRHYLKNEKPPIFGFTPDCKFPVVYSERGRAKFKITSSDNSIICNIMNEYFINSNLALKKLGVDDSDDEYGKNEIRNIKISGNKEEISVEFTISYIPKCNLVDMQKNIADKLFGAKLELLDNFDAVLFDKDNENVKKLQYAFETITGEDGTPVTTTGGTYAKLMPNIVPFGPSFKGQKGIGHLPDEWIDIEDLVKMTKIYAVSLYKLAFE